MDCRWKIINKGDAVIRDVRARLLAREMKKDEVGWETQGRLGDDLRRDAAAVGLQGTLLERPLEAAGRPATLQVAHH